MNREDSQSIAELQAEIEQLRSERDQLRQEKATWMSAPRSCLAKHYEILAETAPVGMFYTDLKGDCVYVNQRWCEIAGLSLERARASGWGQTLHPDDRDRVFAEWNHATATNQPFSSEYRFVTPTGQITWVFGQAVKVSAVAETDIAYVGTITNITARKQAEATLSQQNEMCQIVMDVAQRIQRSLDLNTILQTVVDEVQNFLHCNRVFILQFSTPEESCITFESVKAECFSIKSKVSKKSCLSDRCLARIHRGFLTTTSEMDILKVMPCYAEILERFQVQAHLVAPIVQNNNLWGLLIAHHCRERQWEPLETKVLKQLAIYVGIATQKSSLFEQLQIELNERKQTEAALRESEERWQLAIAGSNDGIWDHDLRTDQLFISPRCQVIAGVADQVDPALEELISRVHPEDLAKLQQGIMAHLNYQTPHFIREYRVLQPNGTYRWVMSRGKALWDEEGTPIRISGSMTDIHDRRQTEAEILAFNTELEQRVVERTQQLSTANQALITEIAEHQQTENALREAERRLRSLLENVRLAVVGLDSNGCVNFVNSFVLELLGYTQTEVMGKDWFETFVPPDQTQQVRTAFHECLQHNFHPYYQSSMITKSGEERILTWNNTVLRDSHGKVIGTMSLGEDITKRQMVERLKNEFISIVSHELRTPLTSIRGSLGLLATGILDDDPEQMHRMIKIASTDTERLVRLVNDILELEKLESGKSTLVKEVCNATDLIQRSIEVMQASAQEARVNLVTVPKSIKVWSVPDRIIQTLTNLLSNAIKFSFSGGTVWVSAALQQNEIDHQQPLSEVIFQVKDQGRGIPADKLESIFGRFQQVDASDSRAKGGTGLGLAICQSIVQQHGGRIWVESIEGQGSSFFFTLPTAML